MATEDAPSCRLSRNVLPKHYELCIKNLKFDDPASFDGEVTMQVTVAEATSTVVMHSKELKIESVKAGDVEATHELDVEAEQVTLTFASPLAAGDHTITFRYQGCLNDKMAGFYRSSYKNDKGETVWMASTQFEATDARQALPCFDEPSFKATFGVTLEYPKDMVALSNMPVKSEEEGRRVFEPTPIMSTYLLAFVVGHLEYVEGATDEGVAVRVYTTPGKSEQGRFALDMACKTLSFFGDYFAVQYPLPKLDCVAIPDFAAGAMENWGLVTYRETALLVLEGVTSASIRQRVAYVVGHELAHQWFGNLVTMEWWSDLWLNEGFATWAGWLAVEHRYPDWRVWEQFTSTEAARALGTDAMLSSHPVLVPIDDPKMIDQIFDALSYQKGACMIRMLEKFLGAETFRTGMQLYLNRHKYSNASTSDLWAAHAETSGQPVVAVMDTWAKFMGYPVVSVDAAGTLTQHRFLATGPPDADQDDHLWQVPITGFSKSGSTVSSVLSERETSGLLSDLGSLDDGFFKLNTSQSGFFRVNYTAEQWGRLADAVSSFDTVDRLGLAADAFALSKAGLLESSAVLNLYDKYRDEESYPVWVQLITDISMMRGLLEAHPEKETFERWMLKLFGPISEKLGWDPKPDDTFLDAMLRTRIVSLVSGIDGNPMVTEGMARFEKLKAGEEVNADLREVLMNLAVANGGREAYDAVLDMYKANSENAELCVKCLAALGRAKDPEILKEYLDWVIKGSEVKAMNVLYAMMALAGRRSSRVISWEYAKANWATLSAKYDGSAMLLAHAATIPLKGFVEASVADDAEAFFKEHPTPSASMAIARALEDIRGQAGWLEREGASIGAWLEAWRKAN